MRKYIVCIAICLLLFGTTNVYAKVTGECGHCHTMHNSQNGTHQIHSPGIDGTEPNPSLTRSSCVGCHTGENTLTSKTPYVFTPGFLLYGSNSLAGGNFAWVVEDDRMGHNVSGIPGMTADGNLDVAPGDEGMGIFCGGGTGCHATLFNPKAPDGTPLDTGCEGCHLETKHHAPQQAENMPALAANGYYRFLPGHSGGGGVYGIEEKRWEFSPNVLVHNEYLGEYLGHTANTMTRYCVGCHGKFHTQQDGQGNWIRHPSDAVLPNEGEYTAYTSYDPDIPVARPVLDGVKTTVTAGEDMVMCLSCHRPHGSPYPDMLRWNYGLIEAGEGEGGNLGQGCLKCHSTKN